MAGFFEDIGSGLSSAWGQITGQTKEQNFQQAQQAQQQFQQSYIDELKHEAELKYNPALQKEKNKQILYLVGGVIILIIVLKWFKVF